MYIAQLDAQQFAELAKAGQQFKDVGVSPAHGELTHRLQWFIVSQIKSIAHPLKELFIAIQLAPNTGKSASGLWDYLFDRFSPVTGIGNAVFHTSDATDFRSPEYFLQYLTGGASSVCPVLSAFLKARQAKRQFEFFDAPEGMAGLYYLAWKNYKQPFTKLNDDQVSTLFVQVANLGGAVKTRQDKIFVSVGV